jgi:hypothetical protein
LAQGFDQFEEKRSLAAAPDADQGDDFSGTQRDLVFSFLGINDEFLNISFILIRLCKDKCKEQRSCTQG